MVAADLTELLQAVVEELHAVVIEVDAPIVLLPIADLAAKQMLAGQKMQSELKARADDMQAEVDPKEQHQSAVLGVSQEMRRNLHLLRPTVPVQRLELQGLNLELQVNILLQLVDLNMRRRLMAKSKAILDPSQKNPITDLQVQRAKKLQRVC